MLGICKIRRDVMQLAGQVFHRMMRVVGEMDHVGHDVAHQPDVSVCVACAFEPVEHALQHVEQCANVPVLPAKTTDDLGHVVTSPREPVTYGGAAARAVRSTSRVRPGALPRADWMGAGRARNSRTSSRWLDATAASRERFVHEPGPSPDPETGKGFRGVVGDR